MPPKCGTLILAGLGLCPMRHIPLGAIEVAKRADVILLEGYTSGYSGDVIEEISVALGTKGGRIVTVGRGDLEGEGRAVFEPLRAGKCVLLLTLGDPMVATTHQALRLKAMEEGHSVEVIEAPSVLTAVPAALGLEHYKFGRVATISRPYGDYFPITPYRIIEGNLSLGLHTLILLDIDAEAGYMMASSEGLDLLMEMEKRVGHGIIADDTLVCAAARVGCKDAMVRADTLSALRTSDLGPPPHALVLPGPLHFMEAEGLITLAHAPRHLLKDYL